MRYFIGFLTTLIILILVHEFGHFLAARWLNIKVLRFSIGFGKPVWSWYDSKGTEFAFAWCLLGGYVKLVDEREGTVKPEDLPYAFNRQSITARALVVFAGPLINIIFAVLVYYIVFLMGITRPVPIIGQILPQSIMAQAAVKSGSEIVKIGQSPVANWREIATELLMHYKQSPALMLEVKTPEHLYHSYQLNLQDWQVDQLRPDLFTSLGMVPYVPTKPMSVAYVMPHSPAAQAGVRLNDVLIAINDTKLSSARILNQLLKKNINQSVKLTVRRDNQLINLNVAIKAAGWLVKKPFFGAVLNKVYWPADKLRLFKGSLLSAWPMAVDAVIKGSIINFMVIKKLILHDISVESLGGPISMFEGTVAAARGGFIYYLDFLGLLSLSLAIFNLLPIPGLDGAQLMLLAIEKIRGKPVSVAMQILLYKLGMTALVVLMIQTFINDVLRLA